MNDSQEPMQEHEGFAEPDAEIVAYAKAHNVQLNLQSKVVQHVLRLRMNHKWEHKKQHDQVIWRHR